MHLRWRSQTASTAPCSSVCAALLPALACPPHPQARSTAPPSLKTARTAKWLLHASNSEQRRAPTASLVRAATTTARLTDCNRPVLRHAAQHHRQHRHQHQLLERRLPRPHPALCRCVARPQVKQLEQGGSSRQPDHPETLYRCTMAVQRMVPLPTM